MAFFEEKAAIAGQRVDLRESQWLQAKGFEVEVGSAAVAEVEQGKDPGRLIRGERHSGESRSRRQELRSWYRQGLSATRQADGERRWIVETGAEAPPSRLRLTRSLGCLPQSATHWADGHLSFAAGHLCLDRQALRDQPRQRASRQEQKRREMVRIQIRITKYLPDRKAVGQTGSPVPRLQRNPPQTAFCRISASSTCGLLWRVTWTGQRLAMYWSRSRCSSVRSPVMVISRLM